MGAIDDLLERNRVRASGHQPRLAPAPAMQVAIVMCMDARIEPFSAFGVSPGDVHVMRNAGGVISDDMIRSLAISQHALGTRDVMLIHHTDCGMAKIDEEEFRIQLAKHAGYRPTWSVQAFRDPHESVRESMRRVTDSPFLIHTHAVRGFVFDVETGLLEEVAGD